MAPNMDIKHQDAAMPVVRFSNFGCPINFCVFDIHAWSQEDK